MDLVADLSIEYASEDDTEEITLTLMGDEESDAEQKTITLTQSEDGRWESDEFVVLYVVC